eukprot:230409-Chlamydomonas_euryale.AAC.1
MSPLSRRCATRSTAWTSQRPRPAWCGLSVSVGSGGASCTIGTRGHVATDASLWRPTVPPPNSASAVSVRCRRRPLYSCQHTPIVA